MIVVCQLDALVMRQICDCDVWVHACISCYEQVVSGYIVKYVCYSIAYWLGSSGILYH